MTEQEHIGSVAMGDSREYSPAMKRIFTKLAEEGGGTWATYMMMEIDEAAAARTVAPVEVYRIIKDVVIDKDNVSAWSRRIATALSTLYAAPQPAHGTSATERATPAPADHLEASGSDHMPRYTTKRLHDEIAKARAYGLEMAAQLIVANIVQDTSSGKVLSPRQEGNRDGLHYAAAIRSLASSEGPL